jgi:hypothetical protein
MMNREQKRAAPPPQTRQITVSNQVGLERLQPAEAEMLKQAGGDPDAIVMVKIPVPMQNVAITGVAPDGTMIVSLSLGIPAGLLADQLGKSRLVDPRGVPTGAAAVVANALAPVTPMFVFGIKTEALSESARKVLVDAEAALKAGQETAEQAQEANGQEADQPVPRVNSVGESRCTGLDYSQLPPLPKP